MMLCGAIVACGLSYLHDIKDVFQRHAQFLPNNTSYFLFTDEVEFCKDQLQDLHLDVSYMPISLHDNSVHQYNMLLTWGGAEFWPNFFDFDRVLIFQSDSGLLREGIEEFYPYDYIGAPLPENHVAYYPYCCNGGLSLRNPRMMFEISQKYRWQANKGEDVYFAEMMVDNNIGNFPTREIARKFSVETQFALGTLGYHKPWGYLTEQQCQQIYTQYNKVLKS